MRIARAQTPEGPRWVVLEEERAIVLARPPFEGIERSAVVLPRAGLQLLAPVTPTKVVAIARNYRAHAAELGNAVPEAPLFFLKPSTAVIGPGAAIVLPQGVGRVEHEAELGVVIQKRTKSVSEADALSHVLGYTALVDVTARELQKSLGHFTQAKGYDTFCPIGPWIETDLDPRDLAITARRNGAVVQAGRTAEMVHGVPALISFVSKVMTLEPGDVIATGTPKGVGPLVGDDRFEVEIEGIGTLACLVT
ncbi:MAG: fumarylacetoacetate hydrolase family protein [Myxococcota bacterium]